MSKQRRLDGLVSEIESDSAFDELRESATQIVRGAGSLSSNVMFVGEAPGRQEDEGGRPFMGASGRILDHVLQELGVSRDSVYVTNIVKYRPPGNRDPLSQEKTDFLLYLSREIEIIKPKVIAPLGRHSLSVLLPEVKIGDGHGREYECVMGGESYVIIPMYHPAATIYNRKLRSDFQADMARLIKALKLIN